MIESAEGTELIDSEGRRYLDGVSSLWCNVHGHRHPAIDEAVREQLDRVAHSTMLGLSHPGAAELAGRLVEIAPPGLNRVFYSDSGSTAVEVALKMAFQYWQHRGGQHVRKTSFICLEDAYHGDTIGSVSVGGMPLFHSTFGPLLFESHRAEPGNIDDIARLLAMREEEVAAVVLEPLVQGAAGMIDSPAGLPARGAAPLRPPRRPADLRRGRDRLRPHRDDVRLRAGGRLARSALRGQGPDRRLHAARRDPRHRADLRGLPRRALRVQDLLPRPHLHGQPARLRGGDRLARALRARAHAGPDPAQDPAALGVALRRSSACARSRRSASAA